MKRQDGFVKPILSSRWGGLGLYSICYFFKGDIFAYQLGCHFP